VDTGSDKRGLRREKPMTKKRHLVVTALVALAALLTTSSCTTVTNRLPAITNLEAGTEWVGPSDSLELTCIASDADGDVLSYEWVTTGGGVSDTGAAAIWTAPEEVGMYEITVRVDDGHGGEDTAFLTLIVSNGPPPSIQNLIVTAKEPKYLKTTSTGYKVGKMKEYYIECIGSAVNGEPVYEWSCDGGEISGEGSLITWTAPDTSGDVTVTAAVFDDAANWVRKNIIFEVVSCSPCEFG
jgi:hypothetical protein